MSATPDRSNAHRHAVGVAGQFIGTSGIDQLRFGACQDLLNAGAIMVDETGRSSLVRARLLLAIQATRATHTFESIIALCSIGRGVQAAMLNRSLLEDALDVSWVASHPDEAPVQADDHELLITLGERAMFAKHRRAGFPPLSDEEHAKLVELNLRFDGFRGSWTGTSDAARLRDLKAAWPEPEVAGYLDQTYEIIQRQNNTLLHASPTAFGIAMTPGRRGPNRVGPDAWWQQALAHGVLGYYLICRVIAKEFGLDIQAAMDAYLAASHYTQVLTDEHLARAKAQPESSCPCGSGRTSAACHLS